MQTIGNETRYTHNDRLQNEGGHLVGRFMLPSNPEYGRAWDQSVGARRIRNFILRPGDMCPEDNPTKERAYFVCDVNRPNSDRPANTLLRMSTAIDLQAGPPISSWWFTFMQWNQRPGIGSTTWRPAAYSLDVEVVNKREFLTAFIRHLGGDGAVVKDVVAAVPMERRRLNVVCEFINSNGEKDGFGRLTVDGQVIGEYQGPTGFAEGPVFAAYGLYRAKPAKTDDIQHVKYEGWREGVVA